MECVEHRAGDERGLVSYPEMLNCIIRVDVDDSLQQLESDRSRWVIAHLRSKTRLKDWAVLGCPFLCYPRMIRTKLDQISENWNTRYLRNSLDLGSIS